VRNEGVAGSSVGPDDRVAAAAAAEAMATPARRARILTALDGVLALMSVLLVTQMWLLTATLESVLAGHDDAAAPGVLLSAVLFAGCAALLGFIHRLEHRTR
jgi:Family of unknown function (DUF6755)